MYNYIVIIYALANTVEHFLSRLNSSSSYSNNGVLENCR